MVAAFKERLKDINPIYIKFDSLQTLQVNLGNLCNLHCSHCHVGASPSGKIVMGRTVMEKIISFMARKKEVTLDITGGCPEMNPHLEFLIEETAGLSPRRMVRSNLSIMNEKGMEWLPEFCKRHRLVIIGSLPCYMKENVERQRGKGVFMRSIATLKRLNALGYGSLLELNLVYNPGGECLPGSQKDLEAAYKEELQRKYGIRFNNLYAITNAPIGRFREYLEEKGAYERYLDLLTANFNPNAARSIMCRTMVSVDWQGVLYNCDFNQALGLPITSPDGKILSIDDLDKAAKTGNELFLAQHCYCCTAGEGSSCTGILAA
jgi:radical SAM/Cys-rich protein